MIPIIMIREIFVKVALVSLILINLSHGNTDVTIKHPGWKTIAKGWPVWDYQDEINNIRKQFFYVENPEFGQTRGWKINEQFINGIINKDKYFRVTFKVWLNNYESDIFVKYGDDTIKLNDIYNQNNGALHKGTWMPCQYIITYEELKTLKIETRARDDSKGYTITAFKDFQIDYETRESGETIDPVDKSMFGWAEIRTLDVDPGNQFIYIPTECDKGCDLTLHLNLANDDKIITKVVLSGSYWTKGSATISVASKTIILDTPNKWVAWTPNDIAIPDAKRDDFKITFKTIGAGTYVEFKEFKIDITYGDTDKTTELIQCEVSGCIFNANTNGDRAFQVKHKEFKEVDTLMWIPYKRDNYLIIDGNKDGDKDVNDYNICLKMTSVLSSEIDTRLKIQYRIENDANNHTIHELRPKYGDPEIHKLCLRDIIALNAQKYKIILTVEQDSFENFINTFFLKDKSLDAADPADKNVWEFHAFDYLDLDKPETWIPLTDSGFTEFDKATFKFNADTTTKLHSVASITSPWLKYSADWHKLPLSYSISVVDKNLFANFNVSLQVCDWLSHCENVHTKLKEFTFVEPKFIQLYEATFTRQEPSKYIRFVYYVEYFKTMTTSKATFEITNVHFGQGCYKGVTCTDKGTCARSELNDFACTCTDNKFVGQNCEKANKCLDVENDGIGKTCTPDIGQCIYDNEFKCVNKKVIPIGWSPDNNKKYTKPERENSLKYNINVDKAVDATNNDFCLIFNYVKKDTINVRLKITHLANQKPQPLVENLALTTTDEKGIDLKICLQQYRSVYFATFDIEIKAVFDADTADVVISNLDTNVEQSKLSVISYLKHWVNGNTDDPKASTLWSSFPEGKFVPETDHAQPFSFNFKDNQVTSKTSTNVYLISDWIKSDVKLETQKYYYNIKVNNKQVKVEFRQKHLYLDKDNVAIITDTGPINIETQNTVLQQTIQIPKQTDINIFKIIFEINYKQLTDEVGEVDITISDFYLGDPCSKNEKGENKCGPNGKCIGKGPENYDCLCTPGYGGINCESDKCLDKVDFCNKFPRLPDTATENENQCLVLGPTFQCNCHDTEFTWVQSVQRCVRNFYENKQAGCTGDECKIFSKTDIPNALEFEYSHKNAPIIKDTFGQTDIIYYTFSNDIASKLELSVDPANGNKDICINSLSYQNTKNSELGIGGDINNLIKFSTQIYNYNWIQMDPASDICLGKFVRSVDGKSLILSASIKDVSEDVLAVKWDNLITKVYENKAEWLKYITYWSDEKGKPFNMYQFWPDTFGSANEWKMIPDDAHSPQIIQFSANKDLVPHYSYLLSDWITKTVDEHKLKFQFKNLIPNAHIIKVILFDQDMKQSVQSTEIKDDQLYNITINTAGMGFFRIGFQVEIKFLLDMNLDLLSLASVNLGDPCINSDDGITYNDCTGDQGWCYRNVSTTPISAKCECEDEYIGKRCKDVNYCIRSKKHTINGQDIETNGKTYCNDLACIPILDDFICDCKVDTYWNLKNYTCDQLPKCTSDSCPDFNTMYCVEPDAKCECRDTLIKITENGIEKCVPATPCNKNNKDPCEKPSTCLAFGTGDNDFMCVCPSGYYKSLSVLDELQTKCIRHPCKFPGLNKCQQWCVENTNTDGTGFECICGEDKCTENKHAYCNSNKCECKIGYKLNDAKDNCLLDVADKNLDTNNVCPDGLDETVTDVIRCKCEGIYKLDPATNTCVLKPVCSEGAPGYIDCKSRNAYCYYEKVDGTNNELEYNCTCRDGTEEISDGSHRCVNKCDIDYDDNGITGNVKCRSRNALGCNPLRLIEIATVDYCDCDIGYTWDSKDKMCLVAAKSGTFTLTFKPITKMDEGLEKVKNVFTIDDRAQLNAMFKYVGISGSFQTEYNSAVKQNQIVRDAISVEYRNRTAANFITNQLSKFLVTDVDNAMVTQCELVQSESYVCKIAVIINNLDKISNIGEQLRKFCVTSARSGKCNLLFEPDKGLLPIDIERSINRATDEKIFSMEFDSTELSKATINRYAGCESNKSVCDLWSDCIPDTDPSLYKCVCNPAYFTATGSQEVPTSDNTKSIYKEKCAIKGTLCDDCHKISDAQCIQALPVYDTDKQTWTANVSCACEDQFKIEGHKCVGVCDGIQCNEGKCEPKGKSAVACKCNEGWYGDNCDKKISVSDEPALGGWIAGVSVLAVVCIMLVVVAFIFYKKSKKVKHRDNNSVQQMNDYSNTSYRVGQHNGNNNDGFNRD